MATKKTAATKVAPTVSPDPDGTQPAGGAGDSAPVIDTPIETVDAFVAEVQDAPGGTGGGGGGGAAVSPRASSIPIAVGTSGYYTGARPVETKAQYQARLGADYQTLGDLGWILGTAPKA
jgi:hypothetical protein